MQNYIEEFFISIGFDTKRVKKESKEIEKVLDGLVNKKRKVVSVEAKERAKAYKAQRSSEADNFKFFLKKEEEKRKAIKRTLEQSLSKKEGVKASEKVKDESQRKRFIKKKKTQAQLAQLRKKEEAAIARQAKSALMERLSIFKRAKTQSELSRGVDKAGAGRAARSLRGSAGYRKAERSGNIGTIGAQITAAAMAGNIGELRSLKDKLSAVNRETIKLTKSQSKQTVVQKGLSDSTRNMIRSYASVFALFQGTVAIKRIGQDFESLRASMLVVSEDRNDVAKKLKFVRDEAYRLGIDVRTATKAFMQLSASSGDALGEKGVKRLFTSVLGISKAFGMSVDDTKGTFKAGRNGLFSGNTVA